MINADELDAAINKQIKEVVREEVAKLLTSDASIVSELKQKAITAFVHRIAMDEEMSEMIVQRVADEMKLFSNDEELLAQLEMNTVKALIDKFDDENDIKGFLTDRLDVQLDKMLDNNSDFSTQLKVHAVNKITDKIAFDENIEDIIGNKLQERFEEQFAGAIRSESHQRELTIMDDTVVVENDLVSRNANVVDQAVTKNLTVTGNLVVLGSVDHSHPTAWAAVMDKMKREVRDDVVSNTKEEMIKSVIDKADDLNFTDLKLNGNTVLSGKVLGNTITESSLNKVGRLRDLEVIGPAKFNGQTLTIENGRLGVNTEAPAAAVDIWDNEVEIVLGKSELQTAFIGTGRSQTLKLGVNNIGHLTIDNSGTVSVNKLRVGERRIAFENRTPGYKGNPGDMVFNTNFNTSDRIFAWVCKGEYSWVPLKAEI